MKKILTFVCMILLLGLIGCVGSESGDDPVTVPETNGQSDVVEPVTENTEAESAYPYPGPDLSGPEIDYETLDRPDEADFPKFPGKIAFHSGRLDGFQIYVLDGETSELIRIGKGDADSAVEPSWDSTCNSIYATLGNPNNSFSLGRGVVTDGEVIEPFYGIDDVLVWHSSPSPADDVIAYQLNRDRRINICFLNSNQEDLGCLERGAFSNSGPSWSSDGSKLAFSSDRDNNSEIYVMDYPNGPVTRVTNSLYEPDRFPTISPDGTRIAFESLRGSGSDIVIANIDGSNEIQITDDGADNKRPVWVGNDKVAYQSSRTGNFEIYMTDVDAVEPVQLTYNISEDAWPAWCPAQ